jgi:hypothetical protein
VSIRSVIALEPDVEPPGVVRLCAGVHQAWYRTFSIDEMHRVDGTLESRCASFGSGPLHARLPQGDQFLFGAQTVFQQENCTQSSTKFDCLV